MYAVACMYTLLTLCFHLINVDINHLFRVGLSIIVILILLILSYPHCVNHELLIIIIFRAEF